MNEQSIDKIKELLKNAPATALWWKKNKKFAQRYAFLMNIVQCFLAGIGFTAFIGGLIWISISSESVLVDGAKILLFCIACTIAWFVHQMVSHKINRPMLKRFKQGFALCGFDYRRECVVFVYDEKDNRLVDDVLRAFASIQTKQIKFLLPYVEKLRTAPLPQSWWHQMHKALKGIKTPQGLDAEESETPTPQTTLTARVRSIQRILKW